MSIPDGQREQFAVKLSSVFMSTRHCDLPNPVPHVSITEDGILQGGPQTLTEVSDREYMRIKQRGELDGRFTFD